MLRATLTAVTLEAESARTAWVRDAQDARTKRQGPARPVPGAAGAAAAPREGRAPRATARPAPARSARSTRTVLGLLDRQIEEVVSNGNFYKQRIEQLQKEPAELDELDRQRRQGWSGACRRRPRSSAGSRPRRRRRGPLGAGADPSARAGSRSWRRPSARRPRPTTSAATREVAAHDPASSSRWRSRPSASGSWRERAARAGEELTAARRERADAEASGRRGARPALAELGYSETERKSRARRGRGAGARRGGRPRWRWSGPGRERSGGRGACEAAARRRASGRAREREAAATARDLALHQELDRALADLRAELNATLRPDLSDLASASCATSPTAATPSSSSTRTTAPRCWTTASPRRSSPGGEEDIANLALRLAISQMIAERAGQPLSLLVLDEIFGSLDEDRRARRGRPAAEPGRPLPAGHPHHPHRLGARRLRSRRSASASTSARGASRRSRDEPLGGHDVAA